MSGSHISLFSGVGMTDLAAAAFGFDTIATAEVDPFCRSVLKARFPDAIHYDDVHALTGRVFDRDRPLLISGGFPCQDISLAGLGAGLDGERSGLWSEFARIIGEFNPEYVLIENVAALRGRGLDRVLWNLHELGYAARWDCLPAASVGAPHMRDRMFIVATRDAMYVETKKYLGPISSEGVHVHDPKTGEGDFLDKLPRAGYMGRDGEVHENEPLATQRDVKAALRSGEMLLPSPSKSEPGWRNLDVRDRNGNAPEHPQQRFYDNETGRVVQKGVAQVATMFPHLTPASHNLLGWTFTQRLWPTPEKSDGSGGRVAKELGGTRPSGAKRAVTLATAVAHNPDGLPAHKSLDDFPERTVPTPTAGDSRSTRNETSEEAWSKAGRNPGRTLTDYAAIYPTPTTRDGMGGPGRSPKRTGGPNLRTVVNEKDGDYKLNPQWVEWLMGLPADWTNPDVGIDQLEPFEGWSAERLPRTDASAPHRRRRLEACGNGLVPQVAAVALSWILPTTTEED